MATVYLTAGLVAQNAARWRKVRGELAGRRLRLHHATPPCAAEGLKCLEGVVNTAEDVGDLRAQEEQTAEDYQDDKEHYQGVLEHPLTVRPCGA